MSSPRQKIKEQIQLIIKRFPVHKKNANFLLYNLYQLTQQSGCQKSVSLKYPCVRQGCQTSCYFEAKAISKQYPKETCRNCKNQAWDKIYLDIGLKQFIQRHRNYILANTPLGLLINPRTNQYYFKPKSLTNNLQNTLSSFIAAELMKQMNFDQIPLVHQNALDFYKINNELKAIFKPALRENPYRIYSFCKYYPQPHQKSTQLYILLFVKGIQQPIKARILRQNHTQLCNRFTYLNYTKITYLGKCNTLVFSVPTRHTTEYFVSNISFHLRLSDNELFLIHQAAWSDQSPRIHGSLIADEENSSVFAIGGYDFAKNDSLDYISCFFDCKWRKENDKLSFMAQVQKNHHLFSTENSIGPNLFSYSKSESTISKFSIVKSAYLIASKPNQISTQRQTSKERKYRFFSLGGRTKDLAFFKANWFTWQPPGVRTILYDKNLHFNPLIHQNLRSRINFSRNNYILTELPFMKFLKKSYKNLALVLGGQLGQDKQQEPQQSSEVYVVNINQIQQTQVIDRKFIFGPYLAANIDQFSSLLYDDQSKQYYVRLTIPFQRPIQLRKSQYAHFLIAQFNLVTGRLVCRPGVVKSR